jgi:secondary thiamine-phosphate synthase enzyme
VAVQQAFTVRTDQREALYDITEDVRTIVRESDTQSGIVTVYAQGATAAIMIQENWDDSVQRDVVTLLRQMIPKRPSR